jgi:hypothetical protein
LHHNQLLLIHNNRLQKKERKDNLSLHQASHQTQGTQDSNCHVKEATKLLHQEFEVYDVLM